MHVDSPRASELADKTLTRGSTRYDTARSGTLEDIFAVPRNEIPVVDDVLLSFNELDDVSVTSHVDAVLTSFLISAPKVLSQQMPLPVTR